MSSAVCFNLDLCKILSSGNWLSSEAKPLHHSQILDSLILKEFRGNISGIFHIMVFCFDWLEKHCGKRRKCRSPTFSPFASMFSKAFFFLGINVRMYVKINLFTRGQNFRLIRNCKYLQITNCMWLSTRPNHSAYLR